MSVDLGLVILLLIIALAIGYAVGTLVEQTRQHRERAAEAEVRREQERRW